MSSPESRWQFERRHLLGAGVGALLVGLTAAPRWLPGRDDTAEGTDRSAASDGLPTETIRVTSSTEKSGVIGELAARYNAADRVVLDLHAQVELSAVTSGEMKILLADGMRNPPHVWLPTSSMWLRLLEYEKRGDLLARHPGPRSIATSTLVIAMPRSVAKALEDHGARLDTWADVLALAKSGWAAYGMPQWGDFILGRDNAETSTSGLAATVATYIAAPGDITEGRLDDPEVVSFVHGIESSVTRYGDEAVRFMQQIYDADQAQDSAAYRPYVDAIVIQEQMAYLYNRGAPSGEPERLKEERRPRNPLHSVYPTDGTLELDHPFVELAALNAGQRAVAADFYEFLIDEEQQRRLADLGFRSRSGAKRPTAQLVTDLGAPQDQNLTFVGLPGGKLLAAMLESWDSVRRKARVLLLLDVSGSMNEIVKDPSKADDASKLELVKPAAQRALDLLDEDDEVGLWTFSSNPAHTEVMPVSRVGDVRDRLKADIQRLAASRDTALYQAADDASEMMRRTADPERINAIVLLSDGQNTEPYPGGAQALLAKLNPRDQDTSIRIFTVPYGQAKNADVATLAAIAKLTKAAQYDATNPLDVDDTFVRVFRNFG